MGSGLVRWGGVGGVFAMPRIMYGTADSMAFSSVDSCMGLGPAMPLRQDRVVGSASALRASLKLS